MSGVFGEFVAAAREQLTARTLLLSGVVVAGAYAVTRDPASAVGTALGLAVLTVVETLGDVDSVDDRLLTGGIGLFVTVGSLAWLWYELTTATAGGPVWFPALTTLAGVWFLLDARATEPGGSRGDTRDPSFAEAMAATQHVSLVADELRDGPKTVPELAAACDLTESRVREALSTASDDGVIFQTSNSGDEPQYALDESKTGVVATVRLTGRRLLRRIARPLRR
jgi:hypothetical protein